eukprot:CAMPEP_0205959190 /NCGR_PEP_ID=MMETSP1459-20131121/54663_1 /ASSEMBLY_ACC=CAM_ASM_001120 /TAXON_ID=41880 /ORGANISM="Pycnococcus provasolii, Strain RCC931" /LENGTH=136 /DNA_ID=CAMNT_0053331769 /DNA_START=93 /DNA_END=501 /DNA_ORIENTATION=-
MRRSAKSSYTLLAQCVPAWQQRRLIVGARTFAETGHVNVLANVSLTSSATGSVGLAAQLCPADAPTPLRESTAESLCSVGITSMPAWKVVASGSRVGSPASRIASVSSASAAAHHSVSPARDAYGPLAHALGATSR